MLFLANAEQLLSLLDRSYPKFIEVPELLQHTLPKFYLKGFLTPASKGKLHVFRLDALRWGRIAPKKLAVQENYYEDPESEVPEGMYEYFLHLTEDAAARTIRLIANRTEQLDLVHRESIAQFVCTLALRVPSYHQFFQGWYTETGLAIMAKQMRGEPEKYRKIAHDFIEDYKAKHGALPVSEASIYNFNPLRSGLTIAAESARRLALMTLEQEIQWLKQCDWTVLDAGPDNAFITTDTPVVRHVKGTPYYMTMGGYGLKGFELSVPLSRHLALVAERGAGRYRMIRASSEVVRAMNVRTGTLAREYLVAGVLDFAGFEWWERKVQRTTGDLRATVEFHLPRFQD